jgi:hypothetical protein
MPWNRVPAMDQRVKLIGDWISGADSTCELDAIPGAMASSRQQTMQ